MTGARRPNIRVAQRVCDRAIPTGTLTENAAVSGPAAAEALLNCRQHLLQQEVLPSADRRGVDVLIAAEPGEAIRKGDDRRWHVLFADKPVEALRQIFTESGPIRMG